MDQDKDKGKLLEYFIERTDERLKNIELDVQKLLRFKWQIMGGGLLLSLIVTTLFQVTMIALKW